MSLKQAFFLIVTICFSYHLKAQGEQGDVGGRYRAMSGSSVALADHWSVFHNQAGLAKTKGFSAGLYGEQKYGIAELNSAALASAIRVKELGVFGLGIHQFNQGAIYSQTTVGLSYARNLGEDFRVGIQINYRNIGFIDVPNESTLFGELGLQYDLTEEFTLAAHIYNPGLMVDEIDVRPALPTVINFGGAFHFSENLVWALQANKALQYPLSVRSGLEYKLNKTFEFRAGVNSAPVETNFGMGLNFDRFRINLAFGFHQQLGFSPMLDFNYVK